MSQTIFLDSGPLGLVTNPNLSAKNTECTRWLQQLLLQEIEVVIPEIVDYEIRRELLRAGKTSGIERLDQLTASLTYLPLTTETMHYAAKLWSRIRQKGKPTADKHALDIDVILAAQALLYGSGEPLVATTNIRQLSLLIPAKEWSKL